MNTKKKNKNKPNKPPNPNPPQKVEVSNVEKEKIEDIIEDKPKSDERVPEIVSEVVNLPAVEAKATETDTPKKPKRNRGKKKKSDKDFDDKDEAEDNTEKTQEQIVVQETIVISEITEEKISENLPEEVVEEPIVIPSSRKKKNKKKNNEQFSEEPKQTSQEITIAPLDESEKGDENIMSDMKIVTLVPVVTEPGEQETKSAKKKNKKKKRTDSERSDKTEEILAVTAAFQKILEPRDDKKDNKKDIKEITEPVKKEDISTEFATKEESVDTCVLENKTETEILPKLKQMVETQLHTEELPETNKNIKEDSGKGKKKNKKDKKHPPKEENIDEAISLLPETQSEDLKTEDTIKCENISETFETKEEKITPKDDEPKIQIVEKDNIILDTPIQKEKSPKPKAKIAKPVEKKQKCKNDTQNTEKNTESISGQQCIASKEKIKDTESVMSSEQIDESTALQEIKHEEHCDIKNDNIKESKLIPESTSSKKRKKSPKPTKKGVDVKEQDCPEKTKLLSESAEKPESKQDLFPDPTCEEVSKSEELPTETKTEEPITITKVTEVIEQDQQSKILENIPLNYETTSPIGVSEQSKFETEIPSPNTEQDLNLQSHECEKLSLPDPGTRKKRKKSPKLPKHLDMTTETKEPTKTESKPVQPVEKTTIKKTEDIKETTEVLPEIPLYGDIEIRSIKAEESEGSSSDIFPDIHYPRSVSQLIDNNNNMFIREVTAPDVKLGIPVDLPDTPYIQGSGETPSPDIVSTGIRITEIDPRTSKHSDEKTDLKSKVIEVNKDMEDLRRSIEKSLAELTAMETGEKETEKQFVEAQAKIEQIKEIASQHTTEQSRQKISEPIDKTEQTPMETSIESQAAKQESEVSKSEDTSLPSATTIPAPPPIPSRRENKGKGKSKKKGKHETEQSIASGVTTAAASDSNASKSASSESKDSSNNTKKEEKTEQKSDENQEKGKQQKSLKSEDDNTSKAPQDTTSNDDTSNFEPIENFEDAMTSSLDDINKSFEMIANDANENIKATQNHPEINITAPIEDDEKADGQEKVNPVSQPKNLLGHPDIPVRLNKTDYKKEKNKTPNTRQAKVKIKDAVPIEVNKQSKESQTENKRRFIKDKTANETICSMTNENEEYVYKYSFRKVFLPSACHVCKKDLKQTRVPCNFCNLIFYCNQKHKDEDYPQHQALCFAVSTIVHLKSQKHIYADAKNITGHDYRLVRMQMIVSCEKVLKRKLVPWEQEALLYPRVCADASCREWRQGKLKDCEGCGQIAYCSENPGHLPPPHQRWCKSYCLYQRLVVHQQTRGRLELKMPTKIMEENYQIPEKMNEVLASMFEEKIDMSDIQYAALTQVATAPLTAAYCHQLYTNKINATYANGVHKKSSFTLHVVGAELQFEADALNKWEVFFLHLQPDLQDLRVVLIGPDLNPSKLPLDLLAKIKLCENCRQRKRRVIFEFQDGKTYNEYWSTDFCTPDLVCAFNPGIERSTIYNGKDAWPATIRCVLKQKVPFLITSYTLNELQRDLARVRKCADDEVDLNIVSEPKINVFASLRPDRNFISDDEMPLLFKNYCYTVVCGGF